MKPLRRLSKWLDEFDALAWPVRLGFRVGFVAIVVAIVAPIVWNATGWGPASRSAQGLYDKMEREGTPLSAAGFQKWVYKPDDVNCAKELLPILDRVMKRQKLLSEDEKNNVMAGRKGKYGDPTPATPGQRKSVLSKFTRELAEARIALKKPFLVPKNDWSKPEQVMFPEYAQLRTLAKIVALSAVGHAQLGNGEKAVEDIRFGRRIARAGSDVPTLIGLLVDRACVNILLEATRQCVQMDPKNAAAYAAAWDEKYVRSAIDPMRGEAYMAASLIRRVTTRYIVEAMVSGKNSLFRYTDHGGGEEMVLPDAKPTGVPTDFLVRPMFARALWRYDNLINAAIRANGKPYDEFRKAYAPHEDFNHTDLRDTLVSVVMPVTSQAMLSEYKSRAAIRCTRSLANVVAFHQAHGRWPKTLSEAAAEATDPFNHKPLGYRAGAKDVRVWSVGQDMKDQGGRTRKEFSDLKPADGNYDACDEAVIFEVP